MVDRSRASKLNAWTRRLRRWSAIELGADSYRYPLHRTDFRTLHPDFEGTIYTWDIDRTYLDTCFDSVGAMLRLLAESAIDKVAIAGTVPLLKGIRYGVGDTPQQVPLYFVSASPPQLRGVIERKMLIDGVQFDGITFKDQVAHVLRGQFSSLTEHVGYKLSALLLGRRSRPKRASEILFGDDSEADALIYSIYGRILSGELRGYDLELALARRRVEPRAIGYLLSLTDDLAVYDAVKAIFIRAVAGVAEGATLSDDPLVHHTASPLQAVVRLLELGVVDEQAVQSVAMELGPGELQPLLEDGAIRALFSRKTAAHVEGLIR